MMLLIMMIIMMRPRMLMLPLPDRCSANATVVMKKRSLDAAEPAKAR